MADESDQEFWPDDLIDTTIVAPATLLSEAATELTTKTGGHLQGKVTYSGTDEDGDHSYQFLIVVPSLDNYRYTLFHFWHPVELYPARLYFVPDETRQDIPDAAALKTTLQKLFRNEKSKRLISILIAQAEA